MNLRFNMDYCLVSSLYYTAKAFQNDTCLGVQSTFYFMIKECRLDKWWGHRKRNDYRWSNSGSENESENTLWQRPTYWLYKNILRHLDIDPFKGMSTDNYRAYFIYIYLSRDWLAAAKVMFGYIIRLGMTPSLCEWAPLKPQAYVLLLKTPWPYKIHWLWAIPAHICENAFMKSVESEYKISIEDSTTNKISLWPSALLLGVPMPTMGYLEYVYNTYWPKGNPGHEIGQEVIKGLSVQISKNQ
jgi:hypothetical protein